MESWYTALRHIHMTTIALSGIFFLVRAIAVNLAGAGWPRLRPVRMSSYAIDTVLLASAIALTVVTGQYPFADSWLTVKVVLLVVYIALGIIALRPARPAPVRLIATAAAAIVFLFIVTVARTHHPMGLFSGLPL
jgi:uncharacterized membrane protein SirB2